MIFHEKPDPSVPWIKLLANIGIKFTKKEWLQRGTNWLFESNIIQFDIGSHFEDVCSRKWVHLGSPYYNVYPSIVPMLTSLDLSKVSADKLSPPMGIDNLLVKLPKCSHSLGSITHGHFAFAKIEGIKRLLVFVDSGRELDVDGNKGTEGEVHYTFAMLDVYSKDSIKQQLDIALTPSGFRDDELFNNLRDFLKLVCTLCLLGDSPELIQPEVLNADEHKLKGQHNIEALVAKARRRGKYGFTIGKDIEVMPHYRRPHLALVWYGPGKKKSKIIPRKGSIVHRSKVEKIPTGYGAEE